MVAYFGAVQPCGSPRRVLASAFTAFTAFTHLVKAPRFIKRLLYTYMSTAALIQKNIYLPLLVCVDVHAICKLDELRTKDLVVSYACPMHVLCMSYACLCSPRLQS